MLRNTSIILILFLVIFLALPAGASQIQKPIDNRDDFSDLKAYFDIKADSAAKIEKRLEWINEIYEQMKQQGGQPLFIIGFRSKASFYVVKGDEDIDEEDLPAKRNIEKWLKKFVKMGIPVEQCGLSAELYDIDPSEFLPELTTVKNGYVSMIKYQNKGYAYVPM